MTGPAVLIERVSKSYGDVRALVDVSVDVPQGACVALVGESGSGKTTLLKCINRLVAFDAGRIAVFGTDVLHSEPVALRRAIGYVPQDGGLLPHWRVRRNVALVPWLDGAADATARAERAMAAVGANARAMAGMMILESKRPLQPPVGTQCNWTASTRISTVMKT